MSEVLEIGDSVGGAVKIKSKPKLKAAKRSSRRKVNSKTVGTRRERLDGRLMPRDFSEYGFNRKSEFRTWESIVQAKKESLYALLYKMIKSQANTNVQICINGRCFNCHLCVLQVYAKFFAEDLQTQLVTLPADKVSADSFALIYKWMLSDEPIIMRNELLKMFEGAVFLGIRDLINQCWFHLEDMSKFADDGACALYVESGRRTALEPIRVLMLSRIEKYFLTFVASQHFLQMPVEHVDQLLGSSLISVNTEIEILYSAMRWLNYDWEERSVALSKILKSVRFHLMPEWYLLSLIQYTSADIAVAASLLQFIVQQPAVLLQIRDALNYVASLRCSKRLNVLCSSRSREDHRQWIHDKLCPYYERIGWGGQSAQQSIMYNDFEQYLRLLQYEESTGHWKTCELIKFSLLATTNCAPFQGNKLRLPSLMSNAAAKPQKIDQA